MVGDAEGARRIDGVFGDVALDPLVVAPPGFLVGQGASLILHLRSQLPGPANDLIDAPHSLAVGAQHRDGPEIMEDVFGGDRLSANAAFGECHVLRDRRIEVVANHRHVEMFVEGVHCVRVCRVG